MWVDVEGVCHTVALPDPTELMSDGFRESLDRLIGEQAEEVSDLLSAEEDQFYQEQLAGLPIDVQEHSFEGMSPPSGLLAASACQHGSLTTLTSRNARPLSQLVVPPVA
jgi:hypothetical protein